MTADTDRARALYAEALRMGPLMMGMPEAVPLLREAASLWSEAGRRTYAAGALLQAHEAAWGTEEVDSCAHDALREALTIVDEAHPADLDGLAAVQLADSAVSALAMGPAARRVHDPLRAELARRLDACFASDANASLLLVASKRRNLNFSPTWT